MLRTCSRRLPAYYLPRSNRVRWNSKGVGEGVPYKTLKEQVGEQAIKVPASADVVVVGGGSLGANTIYHLAKMGATNVVLLEKDQLTAGTTWHTAGLVWRLRPSDQEIDILNYTRQLVSHTLEEETGISSGWIQKGGLFIASNKERLDEYKRLMTLGQNFGVESYVLSPSESKDVHPLMNVDDMFGALYSPGDGDIDPAGFITSLTRAASNKGAKIIQNCPVTGIATSINDFGVPFVTGVQTKYGEIKTNCVVNCCGVWAPALGKLAGVTVPLVPMKHAYVVTERIEGVHNLPNIRDHDSSVYLKTQGDAISFGGYEPDPIFTDVPNDFAFGLYELDWDVFAAHVDGCVNRMPILAETGIKSTVCGPESFTADHKPLMGESYEVRGFYFGCGFNSSGMMLGGGCGRELAKWILHGSPDLDMFGYDIRRFAPSMTNNNRWVKERSHEAYAKNYALVFPRDEPLAGRNMRKDPFHQVLLDAGCVYQEKHGWERPSWFDKSGTGTEVFSYDYYGSYGNEAHKNYPYRDKLEYDYTFEFTKHHDIIKEECLTCRNSVAVFNMSYFGKFYLLGPDSQKAADWIFSNDMTKADGNSVYTCMLNKKGGIEGDMIINMIDSEDGKSSVAPNFDGRGFYVTVGGAVATYCFEHIRKIVEDKKWDCRLIDLSEDVGMLSVQGPKSRKVLESLTSSDLSNDAFPYLTNKIIDIAGHKVRAIRATFVGELGWELHIPKDSCVPVYEALMKAGAEHNICNSGYRAIDTLSLEKGFRHWHADIRPEDTPLEAGLAFTCKLKSNVDFFGRDAIEKQKSEGLKKKLYCFSVDDHIMLHGLETIWRNGECVGFLRRSDFAFALGKSIGYGYIRAPEGQVITADFAKSGKYQIESIGNKFDANIHLQSPFDPKSKRVQGIYD
ncbi:Sarcosine dehydrogenase, mitochondrial [Trichoplax sp. H2]|nr:Sarcosine dehydrogenase, mitochondrial [Trichoplax sp. H2]|eukprot:RDD45364.1 Sarcosine dehydrogenase, mitochondrial [Trichoplax sp. H2]